MALCSPLIASVQPFVFMLKSTDRLEVIARFRAAVEEVMHVTGHAFGGALPDGVVPSQEVQNGIIRIYGRLKLPPEQAYRPLRKSLERLGYTPYLVEKPNEPQDTSSGPLHEIIALSGVIPKTRQNSTLNIVLFIATLISVFLIGSAAENGLDIGAGLMYAGSLLSILVAHEAGHYIVGRLRGAAVSLPYFIPFPFSIFGTMGAVIIQREPFEDRRAMLEIGIAGPIAGFLVALPLYMIGLTLSPIKPVPAVGTFMSLGDSLLTHFLGVLQFGWINPANGYDVFLHPIAFGAWIGLLLTGINLIPAGQLDGGHIASALLGNKAKYLSYIMIAAMIALSAISTSWLLWAVLLFIFGRNHPPALNKAAKLDALHYGLGIIALLMLLLVFVPRPIF